ncbi:helix-turn-helix domain-containing protein [Nocardioides kribbensis]|uniref:helix-turn-helix domain-containing protein n=1 Tax=Nocardioides kribbensis TaxID=305517 RepID=UPI001879CF16|nr:helix-turn-helix domain-containing protein [Nocardioides kribbensis]
MADTGPEELAVLALVSRGLTVTAVARRLDVSERTVRRRLRTAADDLGVDSTIEAVLAAVRRRLI